MNKREKSSNGAYAMSFQQAKDIAMERFFSIHSKDMLPIWFAKCAAVDGFQKPNGEWVISITLTPKYILGKNEFWEERNGRKVLAEMDPTTGRKSIILHKVGPAPLIIFRAEIENEGRAANVLVDLSIENLDSANFGIE